MLGAAECTCDNVLIWYSVSVEDPGTQKSVGCNCQAPKPATNYEIIFRYVESIISSNAASKHLDNNNISSSHSIVTFIDSL